MPIIIPQDLPARRILDAEHVFTLGDADARRQDIRALQVVVLNLMPTKVTTETQIARVLANTPLQVELTLIHTASYQPTHTDPEHLRNFYRTFDQIRDRSFDGLIVTGAPVETLPWQAVDYWSELTTILEWSREAVRSSLFICWGAQAALQHFHGIEKQTLPAKRFGVFWHHLRDRSSPLVRGHDDDFLVPVSRHTEVITEEVLAQPQLQVLAESDEAGLHLLWDASRHRTYLFNHPEYDADTLDREYRRDRDKGLPINLPLNYYPNDDPNQTPRVRWRSHAQLLYTNWLNYEVYQPLSC
ncbi:homoserine O-succinyltransferase [Synechococcus elongatus]|uniref:homoserine O-succinyltransferase n=1 Tax=Synechococcus elongatus TaxID=32046 RepID=UPI0030D3FA61